MRETAEKLESITIEPFGSKVVVELVDVEDREVSILLVEEKPTEYGRVTAVGPEVGACSVGDVVLFGKFSGYMLESEKSMILREADLIGKVHGGLVKPKKQARREDSEIVVAKPSIDVVNPRTRIPH
jgi:co-chaperonin GroES (HSP10)